MKKIIFTVAICSLLAGFDSYASGNSCAHPHMLFDLGNTLIDTTKRSADGNYLAITYRPGAQVYLDTLKNSGVFVGALVNIPQSWGNNYDEKMLKLKEFIADIWRSPEPVETFWSKFSHIYLPRTDTDRKPGRYLFCQAVAEAKKEGCNAIYQGEDNFKTDPLPALATARAAGMATLNVHEMGHFSDANGFLDLEKVEDFLEANPPKEATGPDGRPFCEGFDR